MNKKFYFMNLIAISMIPYLPICFSIVLRELRISSFLVISPPMTSIFSIYSVLLSSKRTKSAVLLVWLSSFPYVSGLRFILSWKWLTLLLSILIRLSISMYFPYARTKYLILVGLRFPDVRQLWISFIACSLRFVFMCVVFL